MTPLGADDVYAALIAGRSTINLAEGLQLRRVRVMGIDRIELVGFTEAMRDRLRAYGLFSEIISWALRFFVPVDTFGPVVIGRLLETYPMNGTSEPKAA